MEDLFMKTIFNYKAILVFFLSILLIACGGSNSTKGAGKEGGSGGGGQGQEPTSNNKIDEPEGIYNTSVGVLEINVKVLAPTSNICKTKQYDGCTLGDVLNDIHRLDDFKPEVNVEFSTADGFIAKGEMRQRGGSSRKHPVKSFRIKLDKDSAGNKVYWQGERRIQLIKTQGDHTRMRHKLNYDLFTEIDKLPSMRTRYVHLFINDKGRFSFDEKPTYDVLSEYKKTDLGIYIQVEYFGKEYLKRRKWADDSRVYKVQGIYLPWQEKEYSIEKYALDKSGKPLDKDTFEKYVDIKSGKDHRAFIAMLKAVDDKTNDFNKDVLEIYFDRENYINWMAVNILSNNWDTRTNNYYLYNPKDTKKFYFVPWDYDNSYKPLNVAVAEQPNTYPPYWNTHSLYWPYLIHSRFLQGAGNLEALKERIVALRQTTYSNINIKQKLATYQPLVEPFILKSPDDLLGYWRKDSEWRKQKLKKYIDDITFLADKNYERFLQYYDNPMTFEIKQVKQQGGLFEVNWSESISLSGHVVKYDLLVSNNKDFKPSHIVKQVKNIAATHYRKNLALKKGQYFVKVIARDTSNPQQLWQLPTNTFSEGWEAGKLFGVVKLEVN